MASSKVQATVQDRLSALATTIALPAWGSSLTVGNVIVAAFSWDRTGSGFTCNSVTDAEGNVYTMVPGSPINDVTSNQGLAIAVAPVTASGTTGPVANLSGSTGFRSGCAVEYDGIDGFLMDVASTPTNHGTATTAADGAVDGTITPSVNGCTVFCAVDFHSGGAITAGTGFTQDATSGALDASVAIERLDQATAAAVTGKFTVATAGNFNALTFSMKPSAAPAAADPGYRRQGARFTKT